MIKMYSLLSAMIMLTSCNDPEQIDENIMMENKVSAVYSSPFTAVEKGKAPGMKYRLLADHDGIKEFTLIFAKGDEVLSGISDFAKQQKVGSAKFTAIGALRYAKTAWFDMERKSYKVHIINKQCELVSLIGDIGLYKGTPTVHAHFSVGFENGTVEGGHLIKAVTFPTVELFMTVFPVAMDKELDPDTDLKLFHPESRLDSN